MGGGPLPGLGRAVMGPTKAWVRSRVRKACAELNIERPVVVFTLEEWNARVPRTSRTQRNESMVLWGMACPTSRVIFIGMDAHSHSDDPRLVADTIAHEVVHLAGRAYHTQSFFERVRALRELIV